MPVHSPDSDDGDGQVHWPGSAHVYSPRPGAACAVQVACDGVYLLVGEDVPAMGPSGLFGSAGPTEGVVGGGVVEVDPADEFQAIPPPCSIMPENAGVSIRIRGVGVGYGGSLLTLTGNWKGRQE